MKTLTNQNLALVAAIVGGALVIATFWMIRPAHAEMSGAGGTSGCSTVNVVDSQLHPGIDIKLLVHRPDAAPRVIRLDV